MSSGAESSSSAVAGIGSALLPKAGPPPPSVAPDVFAAVNDDFRKNAGDVVALVVWLVTTAALVKWREGTRRTMPTVIFACIAGERVVRAATLVFLRPGLLTGTLMSLRRTTRDETRGAHVEDWSTGIVMAVLFLIGGIVSRSRKRRVA